MTNSPLQSPPLPHSSPRTDTRAVLRCEHTADFLAVLPFVTGFTDDKSLFVVLFRGRRSEDVLRIDLPPEGHREGERALVNTLLELLHVTGGGAHSPAIVIMTSRTFSDSQGVPYLRLARTIERRCTRKGWRLRELAIVAADGWTGLLDTDTPRQRNLEEIRSSALAAEARASSHTTSLTNIGTLPSTDDHRKVLVARHLTDLDRRHRHIAVHRLEALDNLPAWLLGVTRATETCVRAHGSGEAPDPRVLARLIAASREVTQWCAVVMTALTSARLVSDIAAEHAAVFSPSLRVFDAPSGALPTEPPAGAVPSLEGVLQALAEVQPDSEQLAAVIAALADAAAHAPEQDTPGILAMLAWMWWLRGMQSVAHRLIDQALTASPSHLIVQLVAQVIRTIPQSRLQALRAQRASETTPAAPATSSETDGRPSRSGHAGPPQRSSALLDRKVQAPAARAG